MQVIKLETPTDWHPDAGETRLLTAAGISFADPVPPEGHFSTVTLNRPPIEVAKILGGPSYGVVLNFSYSAFDGSLMREIADLAHDFKRLEIQKKGPALESFSAPLAPLVTEEINHLSRVLRNHGIDDVKIGLELETTAPCLPAGEQFEGGNRYWQDIKKPLLQDLQTRDPVKARAVGMFNAREIMMYEIVEKDPRTRTIVQPMFGTQGDGGYYDGHNVLELKLKHTDPLTQQKNRKILVDVLYEKANEYGLPIDAPQYHVNFSFWKEGLNIFDPENPAFMAEGRKIAEGITRALYDSFPLLNVSERLDRKINIRMTLRTDREGFARLADGRLEVRLAANGEMQDPDLVMAVGMAGAAWTLSSTSRNKLPATPVRRANFKRTTPDVGYITHVLQGSHIDAGGYILPPEKYIRYNASALGTEMGIAPSDHSDKNPVGIAALFNKKSQPFEHVLLDFFRNTRITKDSVIEWPDFYAVPAGAQALVDIGKLRRSISCTGIVDAFVIDPGYDLNDISNVKPDIRINTLQHARMMRMKNSAPLNKIMTAEFRSALADALECAFGIPKISPKAIDHVRHSLATAKWEENTIRTGWHANILLGEWTAADLSAALTQILHDRNSPEDGYILSSEREEQGTLATMFIPSSVYENIIPSMKAKRAGVPFAPAFK